MVRGLWLYEFTKELQMHFEELVELYRTHLGSLCAT
jgi:hypothetical protein